MSTKWLFVNSIFALMAAELQAQPCVLAPNGQRVFSCTGFYIVQDSVNGVLANCDDRLTICLGTPLPPMHSNSPVDSPVRIYAGVYDDNGVYNLSEVQNTFSLDSSTGFLTVIPDSFPVSMKGDPIPIKYEVVMDCRYFYGPDGTMESRRYLTKQHIIRACASARSMSDSSDISSNIPVSPSKGSCTQYLSNGLEISADQSNGRWNFDHWESSVPLAGLKSFERYQIIDDGCWPLNDTVELTAWYRDVTLGVSGNPTDDNGITIDNQDDGIIVHDPERLIDKWVLFDLQGRVFVQTDGCRSEGCFIPTVGITGTVFLLGVGLSHTYSTSLFLH